MLPGSSPEVARRPAGPTLQFAPLATPRRAYEPIYHELYVRILSGHFAPGDRLPSERQLAARFGVSRPTIREALSGLESKGLVVTRVGSGTFVTGTNAAVDDAEEPGDSPIEVLEARLVIEVAVARLAAKRALENPDGLDLLLASVEALERTAQPDAFPDEIDQAFHRAVAGLTGNASLTALLEPIFLTMMKPHFVTLRSRNWSSADTKRTAREHRAVYEAIRLGDPDLAAFEMERHLRGIVDHLFNVDTDGGRPPAFVA